MYTLRFSACCGMSHDIESSTDGDEVRDAAAEHIHKARAAGLKVSTLTAGEWWEIHEPDDAAMVPDTARQLFINHTTHECRECGSECETEDEARECCAERDYDEFDSRQGDDCPDPWHDDSIGA